MKHSSATKILGIAFTVCLAAGSACAPLTAQAQKCGGNGTESPCADISFCDSALIASPDKQEAAFTAFISRMQTLPPADAANCMRQAAQQLCSIDNRRVRELMHNRLEQLARKHLADSTSAQHNALLFSIFTKTLNLIYYADMARRDGNTYMERNLQKNMPGMPAADFAFTDRKGKRRSLYKEKAPFTVLFFYDPDCHVCHDIARSLQKEKALTADSGVKVLAIYTDNETERWKAHTQNFPDTWTDGCSPKGEIAEKQTFYLPVIPSLYLLDADKHVLLRDVSPETLAEVLKQLTKH